MPGKWMGVSLAAPWNDFLDLPRKRDTAADKDAHRTITHATSSRHFERRHEFSDVMQMVHDGNGVD